MPGWYYHDSVNNQEVNTLLDEVFSHLEEDAFTGYIQSLWTVDVVAYYKAVETLISEVFSHLDRDAFEEYLLPVERMIDMVLGCNCTTR